MVVVEPGLVAHDVELARLPALLADDGADLVVVQFVTARAPACCETHSAALEEQRLLSRPLAWQAKQTLPRHTPHLVDGPAVFAAKAACPTANHTRATNRLLRRSGALSIDMQLATVASTRVLAGQIEKQPNSPARRCCDGHVPRMLASTLPESPELGWHQWYALVMPRVQPPPRRSTSQQYACTIHTET